MLQTQGFIPRFGFVALSVALLPTSCAAPRGPVPAAEGWAIARVADFKPTSDLTLLILAENMPGVSVIVQEMPKTPGHEFRPFLIVDGNRIEAEPRGSLGFMESGLSVYSIPRSLETIHGKKPSLVIEQLTPEGRRQVSAAAFREAEQLGFPVLPFPVPDRPYAFRLKSHNGEFFDSRDFAGRVILVDCWATWCGPCMALMPTLVELSQAHGNRLALVSVNVDDEPDKALTKLRAMYGPETDQWHHISVPKNIQPLWFQSLGRGDIPRLLLIDGKGVLREEPPNADFEELKKRIGAVVEGSAK